LQTPDVKTNTIGANSLKSRGARLWNTLPDDIKNVTSTAIFREIKEWNGDKCNCNICKGGYRAILTKKIRLEMVYYFFVLVLFNFIV